VGGTWTHRAVTGGKDRKDMWEGQERTIRGGVDWRALTVPENRDEEKDGGGKKVSPTAVGNGGLDLKLKKQAINSFAVTGKEGKKEDTARKKAASGEGQGGLRGSGKRGGDIKLPKKEP